MLLTSLAIIIRILSNPFSNVFQKQLTRRGSHPLVVNFGSFLLLSILCIIPALFIQWNAFSPAFWFYCVLTGITGATGNGFLVKALQGGDLSILGPINSYKSIVGILFGIILLGEIPSLWGIAGIVLIIYGSYFVLDTLDERFSWKLLRKKDIQYRIYAMVLTAIEAIFIKKIILLSSTTVSFVAWCWFGAIFSGLFLLVMGISVKKEWNHLQTKDLPYYGLLVLSIGTMQYCINYVFDHMEVGYALALFQLSTIVSIFLGYRIFREQNIRKKLLGSVIMIVGSVIIILLK